MSDGRLTNHESASSGFNNREQQQPRQQHTSHAQKAHQALTGQRRQEGVAWNTYLFLLDAHKRTGESRISTTQDASSVLLAGSPAVQQPMNATTTTGRATHKHLGTGFTQYTTLCVLHKAQVTTLVSEEVIAA